MQQQQGNISIVLFAVVAVAITVILLTARIQTKGNNQIENKNTITTVSEETKGLTTFSTVTKSSNEWKVHTSDYLYDIEYDAENNKTEVIKKITFKYPAELYINDFGLSNGTIWLRTTPNEAGAEAITLEIGKNQMKGGIGLRTPEVETIPFDHDVYDVTKMATSSAIAYFINYNQETLYRDMGFQVTFWNEDEVQEEKEAAERVMDEIVKSFRFID